MCRQALLIGKDQKAPFSGAFFIFKAGLIEQKQMKDPRALIVEWMKQVDEATEERKESVDYIIERLKDKANAPSVGDEVVIEFDRETLMPDQEEINGSKGTVKIRDGFSKGSQMARYTVEVMQGGEPKLIHNLTPGEVKPTD